MVDPIDGGSHPRSPLWVFRAGIVAAGRIASTPKHLGRLVGFGKGPGQRIFSAIGMQLVGGGLLQ